MALKTRKPTGAAPPPIVLLTGDSNTGKSTYAAKFTGSEKVGRCFWLEIGKDERTADWYGRVKGADYEIVEHDGTWRSIMEAARDVAAEAKKEWKQTGKVPVIAVDSMNGEWKMLSRFASWKARTSKNARRILAKDPNAEITVGSTCWNAATDRHDEFLDALADSPAIIVLIARSKLVTQFDKDGQPIANHKVWSIQSQKDLLGYVDVAVQLHLTEDPEVLKLRSPEGGIVPGKDAVLQVDGKTFSLEWLIFERYGLDVENMAHREVKPMTANQLMPGEDPEGEAAAQQELNAAKNEVVEAGKPLQWGFEQLAKAFAEQNDGADLRKASIEDLQKFRDFLRQCAEKPDEPGRPALAPVKEAKAA